MIDYLVSESPIEFVGALGFDKGADVDHMPDYLHPDSSGYRLMGERFAALQGYFIANL